MAAPAHLLLSALSDTALSKPWAGSPEDRPTAARDGSAGPDAPLSVFSAEGARAEAPLTSEPPLPDAEAPLTSEPPLTEAAPLTSESAAEPAGADPCGPEA
ncbi:hypothetical protein [Streptomyces anandii]|uniref:hypothetical protein n=1 Tax=Streptomyces anandii TaxID=285454 RepID=UPI001676250A|nr:hypothetical protein [Streptomyces anandii]GGX85771.1 hypothetical protein GCM10010510_33490 [Streptomyces anandii JCM 4720]